MKVKLLHYTPLEIAIEAALTCTNSEDKLNIKTIDFLKNLIKQEHLSVFEHLNYTFRIENISRSVLAELSRHRHISLSVQSTRWALKKIIDNNKFLNYIPKFNDKEDEELYKKIIETTNNFIKDMFQKNYKNDIVKYALNESFPTNMILTTNARELIWVFKLRTKPNVLDEFRKLCYNMFNTIPEEHKPLFEDIFKN